MRRYKRIKKGLKRKNTFQDANVYEHEKRASSDDLFFLLLGMSIHLCGERKLIIEAPASTGYRDFFDAMPDTRYIPIVAV
ncbi:hypothetical protein [Chitinophaga sp. RAB17]|uniref:hypothetical protein n=1 Tax=Chitinophaga sp. RAB17 TaxID=3233049 RepID=UPI003F901B69